MIQFSRAVAMWKIAKLLAVSDSRRKYINKTDNAWKKDDFGPIEG